MIKTLSWFYEEQAPPTPVHRWTDIGSMDRKL